MTRKPIEFDQGLGDELERYRVRTPAEVAFVLRAMARQHALVSAYYGGDDAFALTTVLEADADRNELILDEVHRDHAPRLLASRRIRLVGTQDRVEIQCILEGVETVQFRGRPALRSALPQTLLRFQRREYYRVPTPAAEPVICLIPTPRGAVKATVLDVSGGGVGLLVPQGSLTLERGTVLSDCRLTLPRIGTLEADLWVAHVEDMAQPTGIPGLRCGCAFADLDRRSCRLVQCYVVQLERVRNAKFSGLA